MNKQYRCNDCKKKFVAKICASGHADYHSHEIAKISE